MRMHDHTCNNYGATEDTRRCFKASANGQAKLCQRTVEEGRNKCKKASWYQKDAGHARCGVAGKAAERQGSWQTAQAEQTWERQRWKVYKFYVLDHRCMGMQGVRVYFKVISWPAPYSSTEPSNQFLSTYHRHFVYAPWVNIYVAVIQLAHPPGFRNGIYKLCWEIMMLLYKHVFMQMIFQHISYCLISTGSVALRRTCDRCLRW